MPPAVVRKDAPVVLVVDDDAATRETLAEVLEASGFGTLVADSAAGAMRLVRDERPTIALLDHRLPDARGTELVTALKAVAPRMPVLLVTGYATLETAMSAVGQFDEYLVKPVAPARLIRAIHAAVERRRLIEENATLLEQLVEANSRLATEMAVREQQLAGLVAFAIAESQASTVIETITAALDTVDKSLGLSPAAIYLPSTEPGDDLILVGCRGDGWEPELTVPTPRGPGAEAQLGIPAYRLRVIPIDSGGELVGALVVNAAPYGGEFLLALVAQLGLAMGNAQRLERKSESVRRLTELARLRANLLGGVSHELRTPLTAISGLAQTLRTRSLPSETQSEFLDQILWQARRLKGLVGDLLDETRLESGTVHMDLQSVLLAPLLAEVAASFVDIGQTIRIECDQAMNPVAADPRRLEQVLINLLHNATKYAPAGSTIRVLATASGSAVTIAIVDDGPGIDPAFLPQVFEAFAQGDSSDTRRDSGLGLGLAIARGFVHAMGGTIAVESTVGAGTSFIVTLAVADRALQLDDDRTVPNQRMMPASDPAPQRR